MILNSAKNVDDVIASFDESFDEISQDFKQYIQRKRREVICPSASIVHAIKEINLKPKKRNRISILVLGARSMSCKFNGEFYKLIPNLMGKPNLKAKIVLIDHVFDQYDDIYEHVEFDNGSSIECFPGKLSEYVICNPVDDVDLVVMFNPDISSYPARWFFAGGIDAFRKLIQSGASIVGSSTRETLRKDDVDNMKLAGFNVLSMFNNPFSTSIEYASHKVEWGRYMWVLSSKIDKNSKPDWYRIFGIQNDLYGNNHTEEEKMDMMLCELDEQTSLQGYIFNSSGQTNTDIATNKGIQVYLETKSIKKTRNAILNDLVMVYPPELRQLAKKSEDINVEADDLLASVIYDSNVYDFELDEDEDEDEDYAENELTRRFQFIRNAMFRSDMLLMPYLTFRESIDLGDADAAIKIAKSRPHFLENVQHDGLHALTLIAPIKGYHNLIRAFCKIDKDLVNKMDGENRTALLEACKYNCIKNAKTLMDLGADPNQVTPLRQCKSLITDPPDQVPLLEAVLHGNEDMIKLLIDNGANPYLETSYGVILDVAMKSKISNSVKKLMKSVK